MKFYITTPIYYVNDRPHIGHAYATIAADVFARYHRIFGDEVYFLTGTDENAQKNVEAAAKHGEPNIQKFVDEMSATWQETWDELEISNNDFIRTTEPRHVKAVEKFWKLVEAKGDIYKGKYKGLYCVGCEAFYSEKDLIDGLCPDHRRRPEILEEENYFFRLSKYRDQLLKHIEAHPDFILPDVRRHEVVNYIRDHLDDTSISRPYKGWGIRAPGDDTQVIYVWFDALINYLTAIGFGEDDEQFKKFWPADIHLVGKDITKFHCGLWPAMLLSAGLDLPRHVFGHGFFTIDGQKISKSLGNAIDPRDLVETYGLDALRYFLLREIPFGGDGDFSIERVSARYDSDLASGLGNTVSRILTLADGLELVAPDNVLKPVFDKAWTEYREAFARQEISLALDSIWQTLRVVDQYIDEQKTWALKKDEVRQKEFTQVMSNLVEGLRHVSLLLLPLLPDAAVKIATAIQSTKDRERAINEATDWGSGADLKATKTESLFPRLNA